MVQIQRSLTVSHSHCGPICWWHVPTHKPLKSNYMNRYQKLGATNRPTIYGAVLPYYHHSKVVLESVKLNWPYFKHSISIGITAKRQNVAVILCFFVCFFVWTDRCEDKQRQERSFTGASSQSVGQRLWMERRLERQVSLRIFFIYFIVEIARQYKKTKTIKSTNQYINTQ